MPRYTLQIRLDKRPITAAKLNKRLTFICSFSCLMLSIAFGSVTSTHAQSLPMTAPVSAPWALGGMVGQVADTRVDPTIDAWKQRMEQWKIMQDLQTKIFETTQDVTVNKAKSTDKAFQQMDKYFKEPDKKAPYVADGVSDLIENYIIPIYQECIGEGERTIACQQFEEYAELFNSFDFRGAIERLAVLDAGIIVIDVNAHPAETPLITISGGAASPPPATPLILIPSLKF